MPNRTGASVEESNSLRISTIVGSLITTSTPTVLQKSLPVRPMSDAKTVRGACLKMTKKKTQKKKMSNHLFLGDIA